jgi:hypothetical protein
MPQTRYWDYGSDVDSYTDNFANLALNEPGVYSGLDLGVDSLDQLIVNPGWGMQPDGTIWKEDTTRSVLFTPPGVPTTFTLVATHEDTARFGQVAVLYELLLGEITSVPDGVVLGWIFYPATFPGQPLDTTMLLSAVKHMPDVYASVVSDTAPLEIVPAYPRSYHDVASSGIDTALDPLLWETVDQFLIYEQARNNPAAPGPEVVVQHLQLYADTVRRPRQIDLYCNIPVHPDNNLTVQVYDTDQVLLSSEAIISTVDWETVTVLVPRSGGTFDLNRPYTVRLVFNLGIGQAIKVGRVKFGFWPYPT